MLARENRDALNVDGIRYAESMWDNGLHVQLIVPTRTKAATTLDYRANNVAQFTVSPLLAKVYMISPNDP